MYSARLNTRAGMGYTFDAGGNKLKKVTTEGSKVTTTTYISGFVYQRVSTAGSTADTLQTFGHEEGRIRYTPPAGATPNRRECFDGQMKEICR